MLFILSIFYQIIILFILINIIHIINILSNYNVITMLFILSISSSNCVIISATEYPNKINQYYSYYQYSIKLQCYLYYQYSTKL
jgi:hypothetical protein